MEGLDYVASDKSLPAKSYSFQLSDRLANCSRVMRRSSDRFTASFFSIRLEIMVSALISINPPYDPIAASVNSLTRSTAKYDCLLCRVDQFC
jgi:hypothetical protein